LQQCCAQPLEVPARHAPTGRADDLDAAHQRARLGCVGAKHALQLLHQRLQVACEHAVVVEAGEQLVHGQQRVDLVLAEPQAGQLVPLRRRTRRTWSTCSTRRMACAGRVSHAVGVVERVVDDRRGEPVAQVLQVALERGR